MTVLQATATSPQHMQLYTARYSVLCHIPALHFFNRASLISVFCLVLCGPDFLISLPRVNAPSISAPFRPHLSLIKSA